MSTVVEEKPATLSPSAIAIVRQHVEAGHTYTDAIGDATGLLPGEYRLIQQRYQSRLDADRALREELPELEVEARQAAELAEQAAEPLADEVTIGQIREKVRGLVPGLHVSTHAEWSEAFAVLYRHAHQLSESANQAKRFADAARNRAERVLLETCHVEPCPTLQGLALRKENIEQRISECRETIRVADVAVPAQRDFVKRLAAGEAHPFMLHAGFRTGTADREFFVKEKQKLAELVQRASGRDGAIEAIRQAEAELADLGPKLLQAAEAQKARMLVPANMRWTADE